MTTVHTLITVAAIRNQPLLQMAVKNAFLHGDLQETGFLKTPPGYAAPPNHDCWLHKSLYGLKQAPHAWFDKFRGAILQAGFYQSPNDPSMFVRRTANGCTIVLIYVDMIISGNYNSG